MNPVKLPRTERHSRGPVRYCTDVQSAYEVWQKGAVGNLVHGRCVTAEVRVLWCQPTSTMVLSLSAAINDKALTLGWVAGSLARWRAEWLEPYHQRMDGLDGLVPDCVPYCKHRSVHHPFTIHHSQFSSNYDTLYYFFIIITRTPIYVRLSPYAITYSDGVRWSHGHPNTLSMVDFNYK